MKTLPLSALVLTLALVAGAAGCSPDIDASVEEARRLVAEGRAADAAELLEEVRERVGLGPILAVGLSEVYLAGGDLGSARAILDAARAERSQDADLEGASAALPRAAMELALGLAEQDQRSQGLALLEELGTGFELDAEGWLRLASTYNALDEKSKTVKTLRSGLERFTIDPDLTRALFDTYAELGQYRMARTMLERGRAAGLGDEVVALPLGVCMGRLGELDAAREEFDRAAAAGSERQSLDYNLALLVGAKGRVAEAIELLEPLVGEETSLPGARRELARFLLERDSKDLEQVERALHLVWSAMEDLPEDFRCFEIEGDAFFALQDYVAAVEAYTEALRTTRNPGPIEKKYVAAVTQQQRMDPDFDPSAGKRKQ